MAKIFIDTEFLEGTQKTFFGNSKSTIDLVSIGLVSEDNREYYAVSKDFNLKEAWNRFDLVDDNSVGVRIGCLPPQKNVYWIRENVLRPIFEELCYNEYMALENSEAKEFTDIIKISYNHFEFFKKNFLYTKGFVSEAWKFSYSNMKRLIARNGKSNKQIAEEIESFCKVGGKEYYIGIDPISKDSKAQTFGFGTPIEFYGYYSDFDWVVFAWLFGKMNNLPNGFPKYCIDLKQTLDEKESMLSIELNTNKMASPVHNNTHFTEVVKEDNGSFKFTGKDSVILNNHPDYPKQTNEHNALSDARFNFELYKFLKNL